VGGFNDRRGVPSHAPTLTVFSRRRRALKRQTLIDDRLDVFSIHGCAGAIGTLYLGLFATTAADSPVDGSFYGGGGMPFARQLAALCVTVLLSVVGTSVIYGVLAGVAWALGTTPLIAAEHQGDVDASQHGEKAYYRAVVGAEVELAVRMGRRQEGQKGRRPCLSDVAGGACRRSSYL
jgi:ammonia channel protein AmtB